MVSGIILMVGLATLTITGADAVAQGQNDSSGRVADRADDIHPLLVGMKVPDVVLTDVQGKEVKIYSLLEKKPTVLIFYRGGWCPYCNLQLEQLHTIESDVLKEGYQIVAVSADRPENVEKSIVKHDLHYTLLSDSTMNAAKAFGLAFRVDKEALERSTKYAATLESGSGLNHHILPVPAVFIVQKDGSIIFEYVNPNFKVRLNAQVLLAILKAENEQTGKN
ncbi:MAG TPA: peroxiredoxin-like family protein [Bacteroidota bacterium]|nr:peroxiredoxin-like family protein [Bacteroidota bacterium]